MNQNKRKSNGIQLISKNSSLSTLKCLLQFVFLFIIVNVVHIDGYATKVTELSQHRLIKRMDLETCLGQFDVHRNSIIRTGESQAIGGKYLQGFQLDTLEECQRLCCETELCDVYIFENKNDGYCYLFDCGTPENFHCKFTRHANYTSAVLTPIRPQPPELTTTRPILPHLSNTNISQQEWELTNLKVKSEIKSAGISASGNAETTNGLLTNGVGTLNSAAINVVNLTSHCGRFQFTCHSGECIAVYNACDSIPQCEDGSDEGPECSGATSSSNTNQKTISELSANALEAVVVPKTAVLPRYQANLVPQTTQQQQTVQLPQVSVQQQEKQAQSLTPPMINNREDSAAWANRKVILENSQSEARNSVDPNSRIFNHKGGLQLPANGVITNGQANPNLNPMYAATLQRSGIYLPQAIDGQTIYAAAQQQQPQQQSQMMPAHILLPPNINWQQQQYPQQIVGTALTPGLMSPQQPAQHLPQGPIYTMNTLQTTSSQQQQQQQQQITKVVPVPPLLSENGQQQPQATVKDNNKTNIDNSAKNSISEAEEEYEEDVAESTEPPKKKQRKHKKVKSKIDKNVNNNDAKKTPKQQLTNPIEHPVAPSSAHEQYKIIHENLALEFRDHDGQSERPGGAVLSLTLGVLVTAALAILIGCRMRTVGRRTRRMGSKTPFSQNEADFLVNGMYL